jgi:hypothetical protein
MKAPKARFKILPFTNPRTNTASWRVTGTCRNGDRIRENFARADEAQFRHTELEGEFHAANGVAALRATRLTDDQVGIAEAAFRRLEQDGDLITAVDHWLRTGKPKTIKESPRLDEALKTFTDWLASTAELRPVTKSNLRLRVTHFITSLGNTSAGEVSCSVCKGGAVGVAEIQRADRWAGRACPRILVRRVDEHCVCAQAKTAPMLLLGASAEATKRFRPDEGEIEGNHQRTVRAIA